MRRCRLVPALSKPGERGYYLIRALRAQRNTGERRLKVPVHLNDALGCIHSLDQAVSIIDNGASRIKVDSVRLERFNSRADMLNKEFAVRGGSRRDEGETVNVAVRQIIP